MKLITKINILEQLKHEASSVAPSCSIKFTIDFILCFCFCAELNFECFASFCSLLVDFVGFYFGFRIIMNSYASLWKYFFCLFIIQLNDMYCDIFQEKTRKNISLKIVIKFVKKCWCWEGKWRTKAFTLWTKTNQRQDLYEKLTKNIKLNLTNEWMKRFKVTRHIKVDFSHCGRQSYMINQT